MALLTDPHGSPGPLGPVAEGEVARHPDLGLLVCVSAGDETGPLPRWRTVSGALVVIHRRGLARLTRVPRLVGAPSALPRFPPAPPRRPVTSEDLEGDPRLDPYPGDPGAADGEPGRDPWWG